MINKTVLPQELETFYIIPALRRYLASAMRESGKKQKEIAHILGINTAAISQYKSAKRGHKITFDEKIAHEIAKSAPLITDRLSYIREVQRLLYVIRLSGSLCEIHKQLSDIPSHCELQIAGCHLTIPQMGGKEEWNRS